MESLSETKWDVVISGTALAQSLLALSLSRAGKKVLHLDRNRYYGGREAAFSLEDAEKWQAQVKTDERASFSDVQITTPTDVYSVTSKVQLGPSRSYTLTLSPELLYAKSTLLPALITSKIHEQVEFLAVGSWWICTEDSSMAPSASDMEHGEGNKSGWKGMLRKIPSGREDIFSDNTISTRDKRTLMKFLRHVMQEQTDTEDSPLPDFGVNSLADVLSSQFNISPVLQLPILALSLSQDITGSTNAQYAMNRIRRHLRSIGIFGPGFGSMIIKYGGGAEIAQVGCRAGAVGGAVYVLGRGIDKIEPIPVTCVEKRNAGSVGTELTIKLFDGEVITSGCVVGGDMDLPTDPREQQSIKSHTCSVRISRSISIVSSPLTHLFPPTSDNGPIPAGAVVVFGGKGSRELEEGPSEKPPIYLLVHSSDSGECPNGQCVIYASIADTSESCRQCLTNAVERLLSTADEDQAPKVLWSMSYTETGRALSMTDSAPFAQDESEKIIRFPPKSLDLAFDDALVDSVKAVWRKIMGVEADEADFLRFEERENIEDNDE